MSTLTAEGLRAGYGRMSVLREVGLSVGAGEIVALLGANGAGKTTTLRALSGVIPARGRVRFDGTAIETRRSDVVARLGLAHVPQGRGILAPLTVEENIRVGMQGRGDRRARRAALDECYALFPRLAERRRQRAGSLSGGEQQMLALGRALAGRPQVLLVDEPSLGLAPKITKEVFAALRSVREDRGTSMLIVEQNARMVLGFADRGYVLANGEIVLEGTATDLSNDPRVHRAYLGA